MNQSAQLTRLNRKLPLEDAFQLFTDVSQNLTEAYQLLERQVAVLSQELAKKNTDKVQYLSGQEQLADQLESLIDVLPNAVIVLDENAIVIKVNENAQQWLDQNILGQNWLAVQQTYLKGKTSQVNEFILDNGRAVTLCKTSLASQNGSIILLSDITEQRQQHEQLEHNNKLAALGQVSASLAHQIKTPLASALLYASQLNSTIVSDQKRDTFVQKLLGSLRHLNSQVSDMLGYVHLGSCQKTKTTAVEIIEQLEFIYSSNTAAKLRLTDLTNDAVLFVGKDVLVGAITNLIDNAIDATTTDSIVACLFEAKGDVLTISVKNKGEGLTDQQQAHLFDPFYTTKAHGTGLGLAVVSDVAKTHLGEAFCQSKLGLGSLFGMRLPVVITKNKVEIKEGLK